MSVHVAVDEELMQEALEEGGLETKRSTVNEALREFVQRRKQLKVIELFGTIDFHPDYNHKRGRYRN